MYSLNLFLAETIQLYCIRYVHRKILLIQSVTDFINEIVIAPVYIKDTNIEKRCLMYIDVYTFLKCI